ncbi:putative mitochondrial protein, partial [Mucuna pruriens]
MGIVLSQRKYSYSSKLKFGDHKEGTPVGTSHYQMLVGKLIYLSHTPPDIAFAVSLVSQFMHSPYEEHLEAVHIILRYLKSVPGKGLFFKKTTQQTIEAYTDDDWVGSVTDRGSTSGYCIFVWGNLVTWHSKNHNVVARSSVEAKYRAMAQRVYEILWLKRILEELGTPIRLPLKLYYSNKTKSSTA